MINLNAEYIGGCSMHVYHETNIFSQIDLEEAKGQEISKLQDTLQEMQGQLDEAHAAIIHEKEAAKLAIEQAPPVIKEVPVVDETKLEILRNHNEELEVIYINKATLHVTSIYSKDKLDYLLGH